jgi:hypothetical protein
LVLFLTSAIGLLKLMLIVQASLEDEEGILELQKLAYRSEEAI